MLTRFLGDERGNIAMIFGLALLPIIGTTGLAIDYSRAASARVALQAATDATALKLSGEAERLDEEELKLRADEFFRTNFKRSEADQVLVTPRFGIEDGRFTVEVAARASVESTLTRILGRPTMEIEADAKVVWGSRRLELALVLDVTGSMAQQNRMVELKNATHSLLNTLEGVAREPEDIKVAILPFNTHVNIGTEHVNATWLDWSDWLSEPPLLSNSKPSNWSNVGPGSSCPFTNSSHGFRCATGPANGSSITSTIPSSGPYAGYICPSMDNGARVPRFIGRYYNGCYNSVPSTTTSTSTICTGSFCSCGSLSNCSCSGSGSRRTCTRTVTTTGAPYSHTWIPNARSTWNGCVWDRDRDHDVRDTEPGSSAATRFQPNQSSYCPTSATRLTDNWSQLRSKVNALDSLGGTNITIGLAWGWHALSDRVPFTEAAPEAEQDLDRIVILMTDGDNTLNRWDGNGFVHCPSCDQRTRLACTNAKNAGLQLYTVRLMDGNEALLRDCASRPDMYYNVEAAYQLNTVFGSIADSLAGLYLAR